MEGVLYVCACVAMQLVCACVSHNPCLFHRKMDVVSSVTEKNGLMKFSRLPRSDKRKKGRKYKPNKK